MFECHITIEPVDVTRLEEVQLLAASSQFKLAKLLMQNRLTHTPERSIYDTFLTGHAPRFGVLRQRMTDLCLALNAAGFHVWRYKIEEICLDSRSSDMLGLLSVISTQPKKE